MAEEHAEQMELLKKNGSEEAGSLENTKFEEALERLESVVSQLESGELDLDQSLLLFQEGITLARYCSRKLDEAEAKIELLVEKSEGSFDMVAFDKQDEDES